LYRQSLEINRGNVWAALLTIHELIRNEARWATKYKGYSQIYPYNSTPEKQRLFFNKLVDIRGDLLERGPSFKGDHEGTWYRMWGMMLERLSLEGPVDFVDPKKRAQLPKLELKIESKSFGEVLRFVLAQGYAAGQGYASEWLKHLLPGQDKEQDMRKVEVNTTASLSAGSLILAYRAPEFFPADEQLSLGACQRRAYLEKVIAKPVAKSPYASNMLILSGDSVVTKSQPITVPDQMSLDPN
jgi:hypothetical protein